MTRATDAGRAPVRSLKRLRELARRLRALSLLFPRDHRTVFGRIYRRNTWGSPESLSGAGSTRDRGDAITPALLALLRELGVRRLVDAPCGDFNWIAEVADAVDEYVGVDVVPELIAYNLRRHAGPKRAFLCLDLVRDALPSGDLVLCRDCLVHFSFADIRRALAVVVASGSPLLLATTFVDRAANVDIPTGSWRPLNLEAPPFDFPPPLRLVDEQCLAEGGIYRDKRLGLWEVGSLPLAGRSTPGRPRAARGQSID